MNTHHQFAVALGIASLCLSPFPASAKSDKHHSVADVPELAATKQSDDMLVAESDASQLSLYQMENLRGGFIDPTGLIYSFAVNMQTALNGATIFTHSIVLSQSQALQSVFPTGIVAPIQTAAQTLLQTPAPSNSPSTPPTTSQPAVQTAQITTSPTTGQSSGQGSNQLQVTQSGGLIPQNIPSGTSVNVIGNNSGIVVTDPSGGSTTILGQTASGTPSSIIINTANNRDISQTVNMTLSLQSMPVIQKFLSTSNPGGAFAQHAALHSLGF